MSTILLIEDNAIIRENTAEVLELAGYRVARAENGKTGVTLALQDTPNLVLCDITMPELDGYGVLHIFHKTPRLAGIPFIFMTARTHRADFRKGMELGADDYLTKPFREIELLDAVESRLNKAVHYQPSPESVAARATSNALQALTTDRKVVTYPAKKTIYAARFIPNKVYFVQSGKVKTVKTNVEGKELVTAFYGAGDFFGYIALLQQREYDDAAICLEDCVLGLIPKEDFTHLLRTNPDVSQQVMQWLAGRVTSQETRLLEMAYYSLRKRVAESLLSLHDQYKQGEDGLIGLSLSRETLANVIGTTAESLTRTLTELKEANLITLDQAHITIVNEAKLRAIRS